MYQVVTVAAFYPTVLVVAAMKASLSHHFVAAVAAVVVAIVLVFHSNIAMVNPNHASFSKNHPVDRVG